jgi:hypothetical protein
MSITVTILDVEDSGRIRSGLSNVDLRPLNSALRYVAALQDIWLVVYFICLHAVDRVYQKPDPHSAAM